MPDHIRVGLLVERRYLTQAQPTGLCSALRARGHLVTLIDPEGVAFDTADAAWLDGFDLIVARGRSWPLLALLAWAEARGTPTINTRSAIGAVRNKAEMAVALASAGVRAPCTFIGAPRDLCARVPVRSYPLILKPVFGDNCRGLRLIWSAEELARLQPMGAILTQEFLQSDGCDLKIYGIGDEIWAVRKPSPLHAGIPPHLRAPSSHPCPDAELLPVNPSLSDLGRRCRDIFGLELYGVDCIQTRDGTVVIEVNDFPNYTRVPDVDQRLTDYLCARVAGREPALMRAGS